jgi:hypothetical protein
MKKIEEFNKELKTLDEKAMNYFSEILNTLKNKGLYHSSYFHNFSIDALKLTFKWSNEKIFPVLDIFRMFLMHPKSGELFKFSEQGNQIIKS